MKRSAASLFTLTLLAACGDEPSAPSYSLNAVLPNPALPGGTLTLHGEFPANARVTLAGKQVTATPSTAGLTVRIPDDMTAGMHDVQIQDTSLTGSAVIIPTVTNATLNGTTLSISGAGWLKDGSLAPNVTVSVGNAFLTPTLSDDKLSVTVNATGAYGHLNVRVNVGPYGSGTYTLLHAAATVTGSVGLPASSSAHVTPSAARAPSASKTVLIAHVSDPRWHAPDLAGLVERRFIRPLRAVRFAFETPEHAEVARERLLSTPGIRRVTFDHHVTTDAIGIRSSAGTSPSGLGKQWFWPLQGVTTTWQTTQGEGVTVAVIDTGVALTHPDLQGNLLPGWDFVANDDSPSDRIGHGTHVAGLIAANGQVKGAAPNAKLLPVKVLDQASGGSASTVAEGILWAANLLPDRPNPHKADVINLSLGTTADDDLLREAIRAAQQVGVLVVAATGNNGGSVHYPAAYPGVLAVTSVSGPSLTYQPGYASRGPGTSISAYGGDESVDQDGDGVRDGILSTDIVNGQPGYGLKAGTSMAAPQAAGIAALALSAGTPKALVRDALMNTATDLGVMGHDLQFGAGLVNARAGQPFNPRAYVVALNASDHVIGWTTVNADGTFTLGNLDPATPIRLVAASDANGNGILGEAGELLSNPTAPATLQAAKVTSISPLTLNPADGTTPVSLEKK